MRGGRRVFWPLNSPSPVSARSTRMRALAHVPPLQRERLAGAQSRVGEHGHERRVAQPAGVQQVRPQRLDGLRRQRHDGAVALERRLADRARRVRAEPLPLDGALEDPLQQRERLPDRLAADARGLEVAAEAGDRADGDVAQAEMPEPRQQMDVPQRRVALERRALEVRRGVDLPPLGREVGQRLAAGIERVERLGALERRAPVPRTPARRPSCRTCGCARGRRARTSARGTRSTCSRPGGGAGASGSSAARVCRSGRQKLAPRLPDQRRRCASANSTSLRAWSRPARDTFRESVLEQYEPAANNAR